MYEKWIGHISFVLFYGIALLTTAIALVILKTLDANFGSVADWLAAIGTMGAFAGTIWIATDNRRRDTQERHDVALATMHHVAVTIGDVDGRIQAFQAFHPRSVSFVTESLLNEMLQILNVLDPLSHEVVGKLVFLDNKIASDIAIGHAIIESGKRLLTLAINNGLPSGRQDAYKDVYQYMSEVDERFERVITYYDSKIKVL